LVSCVYLCVQFYCVSPSHNLHKHVWVWLGVRTLTLFLLKYVHCTLSRKKCLMLISILFLEQRILCLLVKVQCHDTTPPTLPVISSTTPSIAQISDIPIYMTGKFVSPSVITSIIHSGLNRIFCFYKEEMPAYMTSTVLFFWKAGHLVPCLPKTPCLIFKFIFLCPEKCQISQETKPPTSDANEYSSNIKKCSLLVSLQ
jgi:hypothetical protein